MSTHDLASGDAARSSDLPSARRVIHAEQVRRAVAFPYGPNVVQFSPDGQHLALAKLDIFAFSLDRSVTTSLHIRDVATWRLVRELPLPKDTQDVAFSPDWRWLAVLQTTGHLTVVPLESGDHMPDSPDMIELAPRPQGGRLRSVRFSATGHLLLVGDEEGYLSLWAMPSGDHLATTHAAPQRPTDLRSPLRRAVASACAPDDTCFAFDAWGERGGLQLWRWQATTRALVWQGEVAPPEHGIWNTAFSPDGRLLAVSAGEDRVETDVVRLLATTTWMEVATIRVPNDFAHPICFSPDGRLLALGGAAGTVWLWDVVTQTFVASFAAHADAWDHRTGAPDWQLYALDWAPTGEYLATSGMNAVNQEPHAPTDTDPIEDTVQVWRVRVEDGAGA